MVFLTLRQKVYICLYTHFDISKIYKSKKAGELLLWIWINKTKWLNEGQVNFFKYCRWLLLVLAWHVIILSWTTTPEFFFAALVIIKNTYWWFIDYICNIYLILWNWKHSDVANWNRFWFSSYLLKYQFNHLENIIFL